MTFESVQLRNAFACFPSGLIAIGGLHAAKPYGMVASSFTSVSLEPALVSVCFAHTSGTWQVLNALPRVGLSVLSEDHRPAMSTLAGKAVDRFTDVVWKASESGAVFVDGASLWLECSLFDTVRAGDHDVALLEIQRMKAFPDVLPMVFHGSKYTQLAHTASPA
jgi:flavin reductase (DIM6/NTAB) family NADH-FMN oxidoreductase RutF